MKDNNLKEEILALINKNNTPPTLEKDGLISIDKNNFDKLVLHQILDFRTQDKHLHILNKLKNNQFNIEKVIENNLDKMNFHFNEGNSTYLYFSPKNKHSWHYILKFNLYEDLIRSTSDYSIQMRQTSPFFCLGEEIFSQEENLFFFNKWKPILVSKTDRNKKNNYL